MSIPGQSNSVKLHAWSLHLSLHKTAVTLAGRTFSKSMFSLYLNFNRKSHTFDYKSEEKTSCQLNSSIQQLQGRATWIILCIRFNYDSLWQLYLSLHYIRFNYDNSYFASQIDQNRILEQIISHSDVGCVGQTKCRIFVNKSKDKMNFTVTRVQSKEVKISVSDASIVWGNLVLSNLT